MAEEKTKNIYDYKGNELDRDLLVKNLRHNVADYMNFKGWDDSKRQEFTEAYNKYLDAIEAGRISSSDVGSLLDTEGILNNGTANYRDKSGNVLSQEQYNALKKRKRKGVTQDFYANREVAAYVDNIANSLNEKLNGKPEEPAAKFDYNTNGLWNNFMRSLNPTGAADIEALMNLDPWDEENKTRGTTNRAAKLSNYIDTYKTNLAENLDFSDTDYKTREAYLQRLDELKEELSNGITAEDYTFLSSLGATPAQYREYFSTAEKYTPYNPNTSDNTGETNQEEEEKKKEEERVKQRLADISSTHRQTYNSNNYHSYFLTNHAAPTGIKYDTTAEDKEAAYNNAINAAKGLGSDFFSPSRLASSSGKEYINYLEQFGELHPESVRKVPMGNNYAGWNYLPGSFNNQDGSVLAYNPSTHEVKRLFYNDLGQGAHSDYAQILQDILSESDYNPEEFQQGGSITVGSAGDYAAAVATLDSDTQKRKQQSKETKADPKLRQPWKEGNDFSDNEFTATDKARLVSIAADIAAVIDPDPISSGVLGVGSDITNLVSDLKEGYGLTKSLGNFAANLGFSAVGLIPIFGQAVGSGGKVVKALIKIAPKFSKALLASGILTAVTNGDEIWKSINKIGKDGPENEMNVEDWRNIGMAIQLFLGGKNALKNERAVKELNRRGKSDMVDVRVRDKVTGEEKTLRFADKEDAAALKKAAENKSVEDANKVISSYNSLKDKYEIASQETTTRRWGGEKSKWYKPWSWRTSTKGITFREGTIGEAIDYNKIRASARDIPFNRTEYIARHGTPGYNPGNTPEIITRTRTRGTAGRSAREMLGLPEPRVNAPSYPGRSITSSGRTPTLQRGEAGRLVREARAYRRAQGSSFNTRTTPHSFFAQRLIDAGMPESYLHSIGAWQKGGRISRARRIVKAAGGDNTINFNVPASYDKEYEAWRRSHGMLLNTDLTGTNGRNYGSGYIARDLRYYNNKEYGVEGPVNISQIEISDPGTRSSNLSPAHKAEGYDYTNAQLNTDKARAAWQKDASNRLSDFANWARAWYKENPEGTQSQMLAAYNNAIDSMYKFKREMGKDYTGDKSYRKDSKVREFNRTNKAIYGLANTPVSGVHGYDVNSENVNGTTTAQRFIDITDEDLSNLDWNSIFNENDSEKFRNLFTGLSKDKTGRYYVEVAKPVASSPEITQSSPEVVKPTSETNPVISEDSNDDNNSKTPFDWQSIYTGIAPETLAIGRYLATRNFDKNLLNIAKNMPVMLYNPNERLRWVKGDNPAIQEGEQAAGQLNHLAQQAISADAAQQQAAAMEGLMKGRSYIDQGYATNSKAEETSREANWQQEGENQTSRYNIAMKNRENLFNHRVNYLEALGNYKRANYESLNQLLSQFENKAGEAREKQQTLQESLAKENIKNSILNDPSRYNVDMTPAERALYNSIAQGTKDFSDLSEEEQATYYRLDNLISDKILELYAQSKDVKYVPYNANTTSPTRIFKGNIQEQRQGGVIEGDSEKVTIQKLRAKVQKMAIRQKQLEARLNAYEKDMDRAQRSASQYVKSQKRSK